MAEQTMTINAPEDTVEAATSTTETPGTPRVDRAVVLGMRRSPAQDLAEEMLRGSGEAVRLREVPFLTQVAVRATPGRSGALADALGVDLPTSVGEVSGAVDGSDVAVLWLSPDEFLAVGRDEAETGVSPDAYAGGLADALGSDPGQVVDVSANRTTLELSGTRARSVLEKSCEIDLHPGKFAVGTAVATLLGSTGVILWRTGEDSWRLMPRASFATHVARWLLDGMREYV
ncbi:sarcosine oxidase subunit gamma [Terrabacter carboxydivorans]|uniref:Sarcosine oxidase subunit gamma n=1 Tax=Terrabacter carboxydivorans TaxID=619730 RepID=A0ABP5Y059_9MICO